MIVLGEPSSFGDALIGGPGARRVYPHFELQPKANRLASFELVS